jgi:hypothetical protein
MKSQIFWMSGVEVKTSDSLSKQGALTTTNAQHTERPYKVNNLIEQ